MCSRKGIRGGLLLLMLLATPLQADDIRTWVDADGTVHFGDQNAAPKDSKAVELQPGSVVKVTPAPAASAAASAPAVSAAPKSSARPCTPVTESYIDPISGMRREPDASRCAEDGNGDVMRNNDYPYYYWGPCNGPACVRPPRPTLPPRPVQPLPPSRPGIGGSPLVPFR
ncbi:MAG: DUF4124 domain-containing protein [Moraxellaceae bacterium]